MAGEEEIWVTIKDLAAEIGATKPTIRTAIRKLDPDGEHFREGANRAVYVDRWLASAVSATVKARRPKPAEPAVQEQPAEEQDGADAMAPVADGPSEAVAPPAPPVQPAQVPEAQDATLIRTLQEDLRHERELVENLRGDIDALRDEIAALRAENTCLWAYANELAAAPFWRKHKTVRKWRKQLAPAADIEDE